MEWINIFGTAFIVIMMVPNIIYALKCKEGFENKWNNKGVGKNTVFKAVALSVIPSVIFLFSGIISRSVLLIVASILFAPAHILISYKNARCETNLKLVVRWLTEKIRLKLYEWIIFFLLLIFLIGYLGLFSWMSKYTSKTIMYLVILFVWIIVMKQYIVHGIKNFKKDYFNDALNIVIVIILASSILNLIFAKIDSTILVENSQSTDSIPVMLFSALVFAPIVEELVNRCAMGLFLEKVIKNDVVINVVTAIIFAFLHLFKMHLNIYGLIYYGLVYSMLGYCCGYYYRKTSNIVLSMLIHFIWNLCMFAGVVLRNMLWK